MKLETVEIGEAEIFRKNINKNFKALQEVSVIIMSAAPPITQEINDFWYKII